MSGEISDLNLRAQIRTVQFSYGDLTAIADGVMRLQASEVPDSDLIYQTAPDYESNRIVIWVRASSELLFKELADRYGTAAIAVVIDPRFYGGAPASRLNDIAPFSGGARIFSNGTNEWCSDAFGWLVGSSQGYGLLTAAHCAHTGGSIALAQGSPTIGNVTASSEENWSITAGGTQYYTGQSTYRGDVALIRLNSGGTSSPKIYRGPRVTTTKSPVVSVLRRFSYQFENVYVGGQYGETGTYNITLVGVNHGYTSGCGPNCVVKNIVLAGRQYNPCAQSGDSGGSVFRPTTGGVTAVGVFSGFAGSSCDIIFTDIYNSFLALPGDVLLQ